jgi:hypothetical protein
MHKLSKERPATKNDRKREALGILADEVFGEMKSMQWTDLKKAIMKARDWSGNTAGNRINEMVKLEVIKKRFDNSYLRCPEGPQGTQK